MFLVIIRLLEGLLSRKIMIIFLMKKFKNFFVNLHLFMIIIMSVYLGLFLIGSGIG